MTWHGHVGMLKMFFLCCFLNSYRRLFESLNLNTLDLGTMNLDWDYGYHG